MRKFLFISMILLLALINYAQKDSIQLLKDSIEKVKLSAILYNRVEAMTAIDSNSWNLEDYWIFSPQDNADFSKKYYDDRNWIPAKTELYEEQMKKIQFNGLGWFRIHFKANKKNLYDLFAIVIRQEGASEVYLDGELMEQYGVVSANRDIEEKYSPNYEHVNFKVSDTLPHVLAIRYSNSDYSHSYNGKGGVQAGFTVQVALSASTYQDYQGNLLFMTLVGISFFVFYCSLGLMHFLMYLFYRIRKFNLYYSLFCFLIGYYFLHIFITAVSTNPDMVDWLNLFVAFSFPLMFVSMLWVLYSFFYESVPRYAWISLIIGLLCSFLVVFHFLIGVAGIALYMLGAIGEAVRIIIVAFMQKKKGRWVVGSGFGLFIVFILLAISIVMIYGGFIANGNSMTGKFILVLFLASLVSIPLSMSIYFARDFAQTSKTLQKKLEEVEQLNAKNIEHEKEKQKILEKQKETLEQQVIERTKELNEQKIELEEKNKSITDSINYASRIQRALIASEFYIAKCLKALNKK